MNGVDHQVVFHSLFTVMARKLTEINLRCLNSNRNPKLDNSFAKHLLCTSFHYLTKSTPNTLTVNSSTSYNRENYLENCNVELFEILDG